MIFDQKVYTILKRSGWYDNRQLDENKIIEQIKAEGYPVFQEVILFMKRFGGLLIHFNNLQNGIENDTIDLDFEKATHWEVPEKIEKKYEPRVKKKLCLIGTAYRDHLLLLMSSDGYVYGAYENYLCFISEDGESALESIILNKDFTEIS